MHSSEVKAADFGNEAPIMLDGRSRKPDRRQVSLRWLTGTFLTGCTSTMLMGGALFVALDGRQQLAQPAQAYERDDTSLEDLIRGAPAERGDRLRKFAATAEPVEQNIMLITTVSKEGTKEVIRKRPFAHVEAPLAAVPVPGKRYPDFDPFMVLSADKVARFKASRDDVIYGADVEREVSIRVTDFPINATTFDKTADLTSKEVEELVRTAATDLDVGKTLIAALPYVDPRRFDAEQIVEPISQDVGVRITEENVSFAPKTKENASSWSDFAERFVRIKRTESIATLFKKQKISKKLSNKFQDALISELGTKTLKKGSSVRIFYELDAKKEISAVNRVSIYNGPQHITSFAKSDDGSIIYSPAPAPIPELSVEPTVDLSVRTVKKSKLPTIYDGLYRAAYSQGLQNNHVRQLIRIFAYDLDFESRVSYNDKLEVFYSMEEGETKATDDSEILYAAINAAGVSRKYYRFVQKNGRIAYFDAKGRSPKKFLLRKPVPEGRFTSPFGFRYHPIHKYRKMHSGVDWAAPRGTPIIAPGDGKVESAGWAGGCGKMTVLRHPNGYETKFCHQSRIASKIKPGARVRQGQVIGYIGSTGASTGNHLHYEVSVNGNKVDPMRIRLPQGKSLRGRALAEFKRERDRIEALLKKRKDDETSTIASN